MDKSHFANIQLLETWPREASLASAESEDHLNML
jgi:hypothetical protein